MTTNTKKKFQKISKQLLNEYEDTIINKVFDYFKDNVKMSKGAKSLEDIRIEFIEQNTPEDIPFIEEKKRGKKLVGEKSKRTPSAYNRFIGDKIQELKKEGNKGRDNMKIATQEWKKLTDDEKKTYKEQHTVSVKKEGKTV